MSTIGRATQLVAGLAMFGASVALLVRAGLGLDPWDVLHQGLSDRTGVSIGLVTVVISAVVLALWIPLRQRPGVGTLANALMVGLALDATLAVVPAPQTLAWRAAFLVLGIVGNGVATGLYIGAGLGPGPRDGLMTGLAVRGRSIRVARTCIEVSVLGVGWLLGGTVGIGTVAYAVSIGPLAQIFLRMFATTASPGEAPHEAQHRHRQHAARSSWSGDRRMVRRPGAC